MTQLKIARGFTLPIDTAGEVTSILAKRGAGKSNTAKVIVEGVIGAGVQTVVLDPVGHWWGLRSLFAVPVIGGPMGDVPLEPHAGKLLAGVVVESGQSLVLDVSSLDSDGAMQRFAYEFAEELYRLKQLNPTLLLLVLEEADEFAPQDTRGPNVPRMVGAYNRIAKRGRGRGLGMLNVTLRSAALSKNVLNQSDRIIAMRTTAPLDLGAVEDWVKTTRAPGADEVLPSLPSLPTGEAWFWAPEHGELRRVKVAKARSLDTTATPKAHAPAARPRELKRIDLDALGTEIQATVERARDNDPGELRKRIRELEARPAAAPDTGEIDRLRAEVARADGIIEELDAELQEKRGHEHSHKLLCTLIDELHDLSERGLAAMLHEQEALPPATRKRFEPTPRPVQPSAPPAAPRAIPGTITGEPPANGHVASSEQKILDAVRWYTALGIDQPTRLQAAFVAGYKPSGGRFGNLLGGLRSKGLIDYPQDGHVTLTSAGHEHARDPGLPATDEALHEAVLARLDGSQGKVLRPILAAWPNPISREEVARETGYDPAGGRFGNLIGSLRTLGLIDRGSAGEVRAEDVLFPTSAP